MIERPDWGNQVVPSAPPSPEAVVNEVATQDGPSAATQALVESNGHAVDDVLARVDYGRRAGVVRPDWAPTTSEHGNAHVVDGLGYSASLLAKFQREPDGFDANDARLVEAAADLLERPEIPQHFTAAFDTLPVSLQTKAFEVLWANPGASLDALYTKLKAKLTLSEAHEARRFMERMVKK